MLTRLYYTSLYLLLLEAKIIIESDLIQLNPSMRDILALLFTEGSLAFLFIFEKYGALTSLSIVLIPAYLNRVLIYIVVLKESDNILGLASEGQATQS